MLAVKRSAGVAPEMNLKERTPHTPPPSSNKAVNSDFESHLDVTRSPKQGYQWPIKKDMCPPEVRKTRYSVEFFSNLKFSKPSEFSDVWSLQPCTIAPYLC